MSFIRLLTAASLISMVPASAWSHVGSSPIESVQSVKVEVGPELGRADLIPHPGTSSSRPGRKALRPAPVPDSAFPQFTLDVSEHQRSSDDAPVSTTRLQ